jgi:hypothetical protein
MELNERDRYLIERHLSGLMTPEEEFEFASRRGDSEFDKELLFQFDLRNAISDIQREKLKRQLKSLGSPAQIKSKRIRFQNLTAAAAILLLVIFSLVALLTHNGADTKQLYAEYFVSPPNVVAPVLKSVTDSVSSYDSAFRLYELGDYSAADKAFDLLEGDEHVMFYQSMCMMNIGQWGLARTHLSSIYSAGGQYSKNAQWYLVLIEIRSGNIKNARRAIQLITGDNNHPYREEAKRILSSLDEF